LSRKNTGGLIFWIAGSGLLGYVHDTERRTYLLPAVATPKEAATVILLRNAADERRGPFEVLMVHRHPDSIFVPECYVFPGGCIDEGDCEPGFASYCRGRNEDAAFQLLGDMPTPALAFGAWIAAVRETFEETGILLTHSPLAVEKLPLLRQRLLGREKTFLELVREENLLLAVDRLEYFAHWITPELLPYRYDVRFFVTEAPGNQTACPDGIELTGHAWVTPRHALEQYAVNKFPMVLPTIMTLRELAGYPSIAAVIAAATAKNVPPILTKVIERDDRLVEIMPDGTIFSPVR